MLCKTDENNVLRVIQLSVDHNIANVEERQRICKLGLDAQALVDGTRTVQVTLKWKIQTPQ